MNKITAILATSAALATGALPSTAAADTVDEPTQERVIATFEGETFDMATGWGTSEARPEVQACQVTDGGAQCFRTEEELIRSTGTTSATQRAASCSSSLRLYDGTSYSGAVIYLSQRGSIQSLSPLGFNNRTSSYRVGACSSTLYNGIGSSPYPGNTSAWASASSMYSGWSNTISSIYIS